MEVDLVLRQDSTQAVAVSASAGKCKSPASQTNRLLAASFRTSDSPLFLVNSGPNEDMVDGCGLKSPLCHLVGERFIWFLRNMYVGKREMICEEAQLRLASSFMGSSSSTGSTPYPGQGVDLFQRQKLKSKTMFPSVQHPNTQMQIHKYTNTVLVKLSDKHVIYF